jgi:hypothetical protein
VNYKKPWFPSGVPCVPPIWPNNFYNSFCINSKQI